MSATPEVRYWQHVESGHVNMARLGGGPDGVAERDPIWREVTVTPVGGERPVVTLTGRRGGKTQALIESLLTQAEARGLTVEVVHRDADVAERIAQEIEAARRQRWAAISAEDWSVDDSAHDDGMRDAARIAREHAPTPPVAATSEEADRA